MQNPRPAACLDPPEPHGLSPVRGAQPCLDGSPATLKREWHSGTSGGPGGGPCLSPVVLNGPHHTGCLSAENKAPDGPHPWLGDCSPLPFRQLPAPTLGSAVLGGQVTQAHPIRATPRT